MENNPLSVISCGKSNYGKNVEKLRITSLQLVENV